MSSSMTLGATATATADPERGHRLRILVASVSAAVLILVLALYGADYYLLSMAERPYSPKHSLLRPSGTIGLRLGMLGVALFFGIYLYYFRKRWKWLNRIGKGRHWLDFHVVLGLTAPVLIAFHAAFKFRGMAGMAFWIMVLVALSGVVGRYLYAQIPRSLNAAELSWQEMETGRARLEENLSAQKLFVSQVLHASLHMPEPERVAGMPLTSALLFMLALDLTRPFRVAGLRRKVLSSAGVLRTLGGLLPSKNRELEWTIALVRKQSALHKKMLFLSRSQRVFHLWHIVHRPFSYAFVVLALIHICAAILLGYL
jgi:hypothetical protein